MKSPVACTEIETSEAEPQRGSAIVVGGGFGAAVVFGVGLVVGTTFDTTVIASRFEFVEAKDVDVRLMTVVGLTTTGESVSVEPDPDSSSGLDGQKIAARATVTAVPLMIHGVSRGILIFGRLDQLCGHHNCLFLFGIGQASDVATLLHWQIHLA